MLDDALTPEHDGVVDSRHNPLGLSVGQEVRVNLRVGGTNVGQVSAYTDGKLYKDGRYRVCFNGQHCMTYAEQDIDTENV